MKRRFLFGWLIMFMMSWTMTQANVFAMENGMSAGSEKRPTYIIDAKYDDATSKITGHYHVKIPISEQKLRELYFHLYPNAFSNWKWGSASKPKKPGYLHVRNVKVDGSTARYHTKETLLKVSLPASIQTGKTVQVEMDYELKLPQGGMRLNRFGDTAFLAQWYPMLAVKDQEGWHTDPYTSTGDPFYSRISDFKITFDIPKGHRLITSANDSSDSFSSKVTLQQSKVRDFAAVITKDYEPVRGKAGDVEVNLWYLKGMEDVAQELHHHAITAMKFFSKHFGDYPYKEVDVVLGETGYGIAGMEYPGLVTSLDKIPTRKGERPAVSVVAHELAHQWWYGVVGNNQVKEPWLDEGLTTFSEFLYMHEQMGEDEQKLLAKVAERTDQIHKEKGITSVESLYQYSDPVYGWMVYTRPAAMMWKLMEHLGKEKVLEILSTYYDRFRFRIATTQDFIHVASEVAGTDLKPFFHRWLYFQTDHKK